MWIQIVVLLSMSTAITFYFLNQYERSKRTPTARNVLHLLQKWQLSEKRFGKASEKQMEQWLAKKLSRYYENVQTQISLGGREKIDLDIEDGKVGIEIKLAKKLRSRNEVNRLIGQTTMYKAKRYDQNNLIILLVGNAKNYEHPHIKELQDVIGKDALFFYLKLV